MLRRRMDYTSPAPLGLFEPRRGELESGAEISECNSYASQHLDSLRRSSNTSDITAKAPPQTGYPIKYNTAGYGRVAEMT